MTHPSPPQDSGGNSDSPEPLDLKSLLTLMEYQVDRVSILMSGDDVLNGVLLVMHMQVPVTHDQVKCELILSPEQFKNFASNLFTVAAELD